MQYDYHIHTNYSDGQKISEMVDAAVEANVNGVGLTDHCNVSTREKARLNKEWQGYNLDVTFDRRRRAIERVREIYDIQVFDAVELDYDPRDERAIREFLDEAAFDYVVGSVHYIDAVGIFAESYFENQPVEVCRDAVSKYYDKVASLVTSELFDVVAHPEAIVNNDALAPFVTDEKRLRILDALEDSRTVPEMNAMSILQNGNVRTPTLHEELFARGIDVTVGTDAHTPEQLRNRSRALREYLSTHGVEPIPPSSTIPDGGKAR